MINLADKNAGDLRLLLQKKIKLVGSNKKPIVGTRNKNLLLISRMEF